ncbi:MAG TPA: hypothetical protein DHV26_16815 [Cytophagales bacterium]|nr:hypothetical protein [Cytophagales bacterium]
MTEIAPGCVVMIVKDDKIVYKKAFGTANTELNTPMQTNMLFRTGSMGKQYTAIAIMQLVEQGKIGLQDSIQKYIQRLSIKRLHNYYRKSLDKHFGNKGLFIRNFKPFKTKRDLHTKRRS